MPAVSSIRTLAILSYHKIGTPSDLSWETWFYIPEDVFTTQLEWLRTNRWHVIGLDDFLRGLSDPDRLPERSALLTFDDGYQSTATVALPCLRRFGYPAIVFVPTAYIGATNSFDLDNEPVEHICTWDELRVLVDGGISVQSHGVSHRAFSGLSQAAQREEIEKSKLVLDQGLQTVVSTFAFPYGDAGDPRVVTPALARAGYRAAFLYDAKSRYVPSPLPVANAYRLNRLAMGPETDLGAILGKTAVSAL